MQTEKIQQLTEELDNFIFELSYKYDITTISAISAIAARLYGITKDEYPDHDVIPLLDKMVDRFMDVVESSMTSPTDGVLDAPIA
jgi:hypothetical protein